MSMDDTPQSGGVSRDDATEVSDPAESRADRRSEATLDAESAAGIGDVEGGAEPVEPIEDGAAALAPDPTDGQDTLGPGGLTGRGKRRAQDLPPSWLRTSALVIGGVVVLLVLLLLAAALLPGWWAAAVGRQVDGVGAAGILWGLTYGAVFTLIPFLIVIVAVFSRWNWKVRLALGGVSLLILTPNLLTLAIALGLSEPTRLARTVLTIQAPNFRLSTLIGAVVVLVLGGAAIVGIRWLKASRKELADLRTKDRGPAGR